MRIARLLTAAVALVVALSSAPAMADDGSQANDLSPDQVRSLQAQVDEVVELSGVLPAVVLVAEQLRGCLAGRALSRRGQVKFVQDRDGALPAS